MKAANVRAALKSSLYGLKHVIGHRLGNKTMSLIRGLVLTNRCNLQCQQCRLNARGPMDLSFAEAVSAICTFHREGGRCLFLEGGEPFLWRDGPHGLEDVVAHAHALGFLAVVVYTNGTFPIRTSADMVFVSVDGLRDTHNALRGPSFDRIMAHIRDSGHPSLYVNYTINSHNRDDIAKFCELVHPIAAIRGIFFYFYTPYHGPDMLCVNAVEKRRILQQLLLLRRHHRILNSRAGLQSALRNDWERPLRSCSVYERGAIYQCCRFSGDPEVCRNCGCLSYAEIDQVFKLKPSAIFNAMRFF